MTARSAYYAMIIVDIERFGQRKNPDQQWLRQQMYDVLARAATQAGIPWSDCHRSDRGDGVIILIPASVAKEDITEGFIRELNTELGIYARRSAASVAMRMRVALHAGDVVRDEQGWVNTELNTACRLVDLPALRDALAEVPSARLALIVSDAWFQAVVRHDPGAVDHRGYRQVPISVKELDDWAWIHVPGQPSANVPSAPDPVRVPEAPAEDGTAHGGTTTLNFFSGVRADTIVGRDQINHHTGDVTPRQDRR
ncbi:MAG: hypothetical protein ACRDRX_14450 [Pseudonocardiaceae bacterium]